MAEIVLVHGMRMQRYAKAALHAKWHQALTAGLKRTAWGRAHPHHLPRKSDVALVYWADLFAPAPRALEPAIAKGTVTDGLLGWYYALLRGSVRAADRLSLWDRDGRPRGPMARAVNGIVQQSAVYMNNGPVVHADPALGPGAFFQIQGRFKAALQPDTRIVIGHSLGSVVAFEGLCLWPHAVDTFITVGSPIATPRLILQPMKQRLARLLGVAPDRAPTWPAVDRWLNFFAPADVWSVPVKRLAPIFDARVVDCEVKHGNPHRPVETHKLTSYLRHPEILDAIADTLAARAPDPLEASA
jgi:hypothetical protein